MVMVGGVGFFIGLVVGVGVIGMLSVVLFWIMVFVVVDVFVFVFVIVFIKFWL